jgi:hypothetical protein
MPVMPAIIGTAVGLGAQYGSAAVMKVDPWTGKKLSKGLDNIIPQDVEVPTVAGAATQAIAKASSKRAAVSRSRSVYTSPLGIEDQVSSVKKLLLGQ